MTVIQPQPRDHPVPEKIEHFIGGRHVPSAGGGTFDVADPVSNQVYARAAAGSGLAHAVKATVFLKDFSDFMVMNTIYANYFEKEGIIPPARSTVQISRLPKDALIEIELIAEVPESPA